MLHATHAQDEIFFGKFEDYFVGPLGCVDNCLVTENTDFSLHWSASNASQCTITNIPVNPLPTQGPYLVSGGIAQTTSYTINCPTAAYNEHHYKFLKQDTFSLILPSEQKLLLRVFDEETLIINLSQAENPGQYHAPKEQKLQQYDKHLWYTQLYVPKNFDYQQNLGEVNLKNIKSSLHYDKIWFFISEQDPRKTSVDYAYDGGLCDSLAHKPAINLVSTAMIDTNFQQECVIEANKEYFITKIYLSNTP